MTDSVPSAVFWSLVAVALILTGAVVRLLWTAAAHRRRIADLAGGVEARDTSLRTLVEDRLPLLEKNHRPFGPVVPDPRLEGTSHALSVHLIEEMFGGAVRRAQIRADQSAKAALKGAMRALQGLANEQQLAISDMQDEYDRPDILGSLLEIDHTNAQFGRRAQAIAVLCGSWPGRQREASSLMDVARGAKSRIRDYRRVQVHEQIEVAVVSRAVEPVVLAIAELLDNATRHSQPNTTVEVNIQPAHNGACVVVDDAGVGMNDKEIEAAVRFIGGDEYIDITRLGDPPQFGFAVVGVLAQRYGFSVSVDTRSPYGGVRAVLFLPRELLTHLEPEDVPGLVRELRPPVPAQALPAAPRPTAPEPREAHEARPAHVAEPVHAADPVHTGHPVHPTDATRPADAASPTDEVRPVREDRQAHGHAGQPEEPMPVDVVGSTAAGLPKRRRRDAAAPAARAARPTAATEAAAAADAVATDTARGRSVHETAARMGAFARGTRSGRAAVRDGDEGHGDDQDKGIAHS
ncbi:ATP-binding protein [Streptodolium elevatio]